MKVSELMTKNPTCVTLDQSIRDAAIQMEKCDCGCLPVSDDKNGGRLVGVITDRDIAIRAVARGFGPDARVRDVMTPNPASCRADDDVKELERIMSEKQVRRVPVVDDSGRCLGIVAQADLARAADQEKDISDRDVAQVIENISAPTAGAAH